MIRTESIHQRGVVEVFSYDDEDPPGTRSLVFRIRPRARIIQHYPQYRWFPLDMITYEGFDSPPEEVNERGYFRSDAVPTMLRRKLPQAGVTELVISRERESNMRRVATGRKLVLSYSDFQRIVASLRASTTAYYSDLRSTSDVLFNDIFPNVFELGEASPQTRLNRLLSNLDRSVIQSMTGEQINRLLDFTSRVVETRYVRREYRRRLEVGAKLKMDEVALSSIVTEFEDMLGGHHLEAPWGRFVKRILYLVEARYVHVFDRLNVITGRSREVDFGLVDTHGYLDIFEIKTPQTRLLASQADRGNFYWSTDAVKAITQAEKYLYNAERLGADLEHHIRRELDTEVRVTRPRGVLLLGSSSQLDNERKKEDFRVLRMSLRNVEIILYDELLERIKNIKDKDPGIDE